MKKTCCDHSVKSKRGYWIMLAFVLIFATPSLLAVLFFRHPTWLGHVSTNRGQFVKPHYQLESFSRGEKHWHLVLWSPLQCSATCMQQAETLARIRLALGRRLYQVDASLMLNASTPSLTKSQAEILHNEDIHVLKLSADRKADEAHLGNDMAFYIVNPEGSLVLSYPISVAADDIFHDIKQLVSQS